MYSIRNLLQNKYKNNAIKKIAKIFNCDYKIAAKNLFILIDKKLSDRNIYHILHQNYHDLFRYKPNDEALTRSIKKIKQIEPIIQNIHINNGIYLDIGTEDPYFPTEMAKLLNNNNIKCINIDSWESNYNIDTLNFNITRYDGKNIPLEDNSVSVITIIMVLHHVDQNIVCELIQNIYRVLINGGIVIVKEHDSNGDIDEYLDFLHRCYDSILHDNFVWNETYNTNYMSEKKLEDMFITNNLNPIITIPFSHYDNSYYKIFIK